MLDNIVSEISSPLITKPAVLTQKLKRMAAITVLDQNSVFNREKSEKKRRIMQMFIGINIYILNEI